MVTVVYLLLFFVSLAFSKKVFHRWLNFVSVFTFIWCLFGFLSTLGIDNMRKPSLEIHELSWTFVFVFDFVSLVFINRRKRVIERALEDCRQKKTKYTVVGFIELVSLILCLPTAFKMLSYLITQGFSSLRFFFFSGDVYSNQFFDLLFRSMPVGILTGLIIVYTYLFFKTDKFLYLLISLFNAIFVTFMNGGGRFPFLYLLLSLLILFFLMPNQPKQGERKIKAFVIGVGVILVVVLVVITFLRGQDFFVGVVRYYSGSLSYLDLIFEHKTQFGLDDYSYGYLGLSSIIEPIVLLGKSIGLTAAKTPGYLFNSVCQPFVNIGIESNPIYFNNNTTIIYYFFRDFGVFGVVLGSGLLSLLTAHFYCSCKTNHCLPKLLFLVLCINSFNSIMTFQLFGMTPLYFAIAFIACSIDEKEKQYRSYYYCEKSRVNNFVEG